MGGLQRRISVSSDAGSLGLNGRLSFPSLPSSPLSLLPSLSVIPFLLFVPLPPFLPSPPGLGCFHDNRPRRRSRRSPMPGGSGNSPCPRRHSLPAAAASTAVPLCLCCVCVQAACGDVRDRACACIFVRGLYGRCSYMYVCVYVVLSRDWCSVLPLKAAHTRCPAGG